MPNKQPHSSLDPQILIRQVLNVMQARYESWPESVRSLAYNLAAELFIIRYNPFINPHIVQKSVFSRLNLEKKTLSEEYRQTISEGLERYWEEFAADQKFRQKVLHKLRGILPVKNIVTSPHILLECATDATDLRMEMPMMVIFPEDTAQVQSVVKLANQMGFGIVPRGGATGLTGGAIPGARRSVVLSTSRLKEIKKIDAEEMALCAQAGVITLDAIRAAAEKDLLFTVDPASKAASSLGGNVSENAGGPFAFEYGTTLDNILSYKMVTPEGRLIEVRRINHPRHKILPDETVIFQVVDEQGQDLHRVSLTGAEIRTPGLGKDVTNKYLGGLPGIQKEGVDGIITEACFTLHPKLSYFRVLCLEFYGHSMHKAMLVINDLVGLRDEIRRGGDKVKISALEEFGSKYVQAIEYQKKSSRYEGEPISVLILQLDSDDPQAVDLIVDRIVDVVSPYDLVDVFVASDKREAELFWEDRHRLSAITRHTSGFKINEDVVIPLQAIPEFSDFIENLNLYYLALAYRKALNKARELKEVNLDDEFIQMEQQVIQGVLNGATTKNELPEQLFQLQLVFFFQDLKSRYPNHMEELQAILDELQRSRVIIANHMHAGDGNCHVNLPVNSNDPEMMHLAEEAAGKVFEEVLRLGGQVSGEHGIGVTKIKYLSQDKIDALKIYKEKVDPRNIFNPGKLIQKELTAAPYTFSFNRLIQDLNSAGLKEKDLLIHILKNIQHCSHCGKCKQTCPMYLPRQGLLYHPRNKNISLAGLIEALYYSILAQGNPDKEVLDQLRGIVEHCTGCGKCTHGCPVKITSNAVALETRHYLADRDASGHPLKDLLLRYAAHEPGVRIPRLARAAGTGQRLQNALLSLAPTGWRKKSFHPLLQGRAPAPEYSQLPGILSLQRHNLFLPREFNGKRTVIYFPGCGSGLFFPGIALSSMSLLLASGVNVALAEKHLCCAYPLLASGQMDTAHRIQRESRLTLQELIKNLLEKDLKPTHILTSCGTCREALKDYRLPGEDHVLEQMDVVQFLLEATDIQGTGKNESIVYHPSCHPEWSVSNPLKASEACAQSLAGFLGIGVDISSGCCGESGLGGITAPKVFNPVRAEKMNGLLKILPENKKQTSLLVGCPSCKIGISRCLDAAGRKVQVKHTSEYLAQLLLGDAWRKNLMLNLKNGKNSHGALYMQ